MFARVLILDSVLKNKLGHHYETTRLLTEAYRQRGSSVLVYGHETVPAEMQSELDVRPLFRLGLYASSGKPPRYGVAHDWARTNEACELDLAALESLGLGPDDLVLVHTTWSSQLLGLHAWYRGLMPPRPRICLCLHFPPDLNVPANEAEVAVALHKRALQPWLSEGRDEVLVATAANHELAAYLSGLCAGPVATLPMVMPTDDLPLARGSARDQPTLLYLGGTRPEKGIWELVAALEAHRHAARFLIHVQQADLAQEIRRRVAANAVEIVEGPLDRAGYAGLFARADAVLMPYDPKEYRLRTSGIFVEAISAGRPVLVTAGTWMDGELARLGGPGVAVADRSPEGLAAAIASLAQSLPGVTALAKAAAPAYRERHRAAALVDAIAAHFAGTPSPARLAPGPVS